MVCITVFSNDPIDNTSIIDNIDVGIDLVPSFPKPLFEPMLTPWCHWMSSIISWWVNIQWSKTWNEQLDMGCEQLNFERLFLQHSCYWRKQDVANNYLNQSWPWSLQYIHVSHLAKETVAISQIFCPFVSGMNGNLFMQHPIKWMSHLACDLYSGRPLWSYR